MQVPSPGEQALPPGVSSYLATRSFPCSSVSFLTSVLFLGDFAVETAKWSAEVLPAAPEHVKAMACLWERLRRASLRPEYSAVGREFRANESTISLNKV